MSRGSKFVAVLLCLIVIVFVIRIDYLQRTKLKTEIGDSYKQRIDYYSRTTSMWLMNMDNDKINNELLNKISITIGNINDQEDYIPHTSVREFEFCFSAIKTDIVDKLINNKEPLSPNKRKSLVKLLNESLIQLHDTLKMVQHEFNENSLIYYKELNNDDSKISRQVIKTMHDLSLKIEKTK